MNGKIKIAAVVVGILLFTSVLSLSVDGEEYSFNFDGTDKAEEALDGYIDSLPDDIRDTLPDDAKNTDTAEKYDFHYFWGVICKAFSKAAAPAMKTFSALFGIVIICSVFRALAKTVSGARLEKVFAFCCSLCAALSLFQVQRSVSEVVGGMLDTLSSSMLTIVPVMETLYLTSGNISSAAVLSTGMNLMIAFAEEIYSSVLFPAANICFVLALCAAVTGNHGIAFMSKTLRGIVTGAVVLVMTLMSFVFALQTETAGAADSFASKTLRFAIGSYVPIIGGTVSDSFSFLAGSLDIIKQLCGVTGIAVVIITFVSPLFIVVANRLAIAAAGALAGMLGCDREREVLNETGSVFTIMIAVGVAAAVMFIIALSVFCRTPSAIG